MERLLKEAQDLAEQGVKELILVAQETTLYGKDLYGEKSLPKLLVNFARSADFAGSVFYTVIRKRLQMN